MCVIFLKNMHPVRIGWWAALVVVVLILVASLCCGASTKKREELNNGRCCQQNMRQGTRDVEGGDGGEGSRSDSVITESSRADPLHMNKING